MAEHPHTELRRGRDTIINGERVQDHRHHDKLISPAPEKPERKR